MNIKSLLLGSAVAFSATGAYAADAIIIAEPEPVEYVRVCDAYGTGFFYVPGTETCLKVGGYVRYQIEYKDDNDTVTKLARFAPSFDARSSTAWGTLRAYGEFEIDWSSNLHVDTDDLDRGVSRSTLRHAFIEIGDQNFLRIGKAWNALRAWAPTGYGVNDLQLNANRYSLAQITYVFNGTNGAGIGGGLGLSGFVSVVESDGDDFNPSIEAGLGYAWGPRTGTNFARLAVGYDTDDGSLMARGNIDVALGSIATGRLVVTYVNDEAGYYRDAIGGSEWSVMAAVEVKATDTVGLHLAGAWYDDGPSWDYTEREWAAVAGVNWQPFGNSSLQIRPEVEFTSNRHGDDNWGATVRFQRNF